MCHKHALIRPKRSQFYPRRALEAREHLVAPCARKERSCGVFLTRTRRVEHLTRAHLTM